MNHRVWIAVVLYLPLVSGACTRLAYEKVKARMERSSIAVESLPRGLREVDPQKITRLRARAKPSPPGFSWKVWTDFAPGYYIHVQRDTLALRQTQELLFATEYYGLGLLVGRLIFKREVRSAYLADPPTLTHYWSTTSILYPLIELDEQMHSGTRVTMANYEKACLLSFGILGWGREGGQRYMQFFWLHVPMGRTR